MTKSELIAEISNRTGQAKSDVEKTLKSFEDIAHEIVAKGSVRRAWTGLEVSGPTAMREWKSQGGLQITRVAPGGPAEKAGLKAELAEVTMKPATENALAGEDAARMQKLLDALESLDDVQEVYTTAVLEPGAA